MSVKRNEHIFGGALAWEPCFRKLRRFLSKRDILCAAEKRLSTPADAKRRLYPIRIGMIQRNGEKTMSLLCFKATDMKPFPHLAPGTRPGRFALITEGTPDRGSAGRGLALITPG